MGVNHPGQGAADDLKRVQRNQGVATMQNTSISRANFTVRDGGHIIIENGGLDVTGSANITGALTGSGTIDWTGPSIFRGTVNITGNMATSGTLVVVGATTLNGDVTLNNDLALGTGRIVVGNMVIQKTGGFSGEVNSSGILYLRGAGITMTGSVTVQNNMTILGDFDVIGAKSFKMPHPSKPETHWLRHGSTESPVSGIEYWGNGTIDADGSVTVDLPDYFEDLAKPENRSVFVTGRGFNADWTDIEGGKFTVTGTPGGRFSWLVKAERFGGDFLLEEEMPAPEPDEGE